MTVAGADTRSRFNDGRLPAGHDPANYEHISEQTVYHTGLVAIIFGTFARIPSKCVTFAERISLSYYHHAKY